MRQAINHANKNKMKRYIIIFITNLLVSNIIVAQDIENDYDFVADNVATENSDGACEETDSLDMFDDSELSGDSIMRFYQPVKDSTYNADNGIYDLPESMTTNIDSLLNSWYAINLLNSLDCDSREVSPKTFSDSVYAQRLYNMPTIMEMTYNSIVRQYIDRYTTKSRTLVSYMLGMSHFYMPIIEDAIDKYNMPYELKYLPIIESALKPKAVSRAGAKGLWQFMFGTSKLYGLKSNNYIEERFDPIKSTDAAMRYLRDLYNAFGSWELALAAYNCGPGRVKKAIIRSGGKHNFWEIYNYLPRETRGYVPAFIAANYVMTYHDEHGICPMEPKVPVATDTLHITRNLHFSQISELCNIPLDDIRAINPQYVRDIVPGENEACVIRLTNETITKFIAFGDSIYSYNEEKFFPKDKVAKMLKEAKSNNEYGSGDMIRHKIKNGETLGGIARKYRVSTKKLMKWNNLKNSRIRAGRYLKIYK